MNTLSDRIVYKFTFGASSSDRTFRYVITEGSSTIFIGNIFIAKNSTSSEIYLTEIFKAQTQKIDYFDLSDSSFIQTAEDLVRRFMINVIYVDGPQIIGTAIFDVLMGYPYPYKDFNMNMLHNNIECSSTDFNNHLSVPLQGVNYNYDERYKQSFDLCPRYPYLSTDKMKFIQVLNNGDNITDFYLGSSKDETYNRTVHYTERASYNEVVGVNLDVLYNNTTDIDEIDLFSNTFNYTSISGTKAWTVDLYSAHLSEDAMVMKLFNNLNINTGVLSQLYYDDGATQHFYIEIDGDEQDDVMDYLAENGYTRMVADDVVNTPTYNLFSPVYSVIKGGQTITSDDYQKFVKWIINAMPYIDEEYIISKWKIKVGNKWPNNLTLSMPADILKISQIDTWRTIFETFDYDGVKYTEFFTEDSFYISNKEMKETYKETIHADGPVKIADIDECPAKYYVQWVDRFGGVQCQPFDGKETKSIKYDVTKITNRYNERRPISFDNTNSFDLNTTFIKDEEYYYYESLLVSPYIYLFDTERDKGYKVIVSDSDYTEKTYKNQKKLFNLEVNFEIDKNENLLY